MVEFFLAYDPQTVVSVREYNFSSSDPPITLRFCILCSWFPLSSSTSRSKSYTAKQPSPPNYVTNYEIPFSRLVGGAAHVQTTPPYTYIRNYTYTAERNTCICTATRLVLLVGRSLILDAVAPPLVRVPVPQIWLRRCTPQGLVRLASASSAMRLREMKTTSSLLRFRVKVIRFDQMS